MSLFHNNLTFKTLRQQGLLYGLQKPTIEHHLFTYTLNSQCITKEATASYFSTTYTTQSEYRKQAYNLKTLNLVPKRPVRRKPVAAPGQVTVEPIDIYLRNLHIDCLALFPVSIKVTETARSPILLIPLRI